MEIVKEAKQWKATDLTPNNINWEKKKKKRQSSETSQ